MPPSEPLPLVWPHCIAVDTREQTPFTFEGLRADARQGRRPLVIPTERRTLNAGDYSVCGYEAQVAVERKSLADLYNTLGQGRERFERELHRLQRLAFAAVVIEADWVEIIQQPPDRSRLNPKTIFRSVIAWQQRYPGIHWWACPGRTFAEHCTFRILQRFIYKRLPNDPTAQLPSPADADDESDLHEWRGASAPNLP